MQKIKQQNQANSTQSTRVLVGVSCLVGWVKSALVWFVRLGQKNGEVSQTLYLLNKLNKLNKSNIKPQLKRLTRATLRACGGENQTEQTEQNFFAQNRTVSAGQAAFLIEIFKKQLFSLALENRFRSVMQHV